MPLSSLRATVLARRTHGEGPGRPRPPISIWLRLLSAVVLITLLLVACGGTSNPAGNGTTPVTSSVQPTTSPSSAATPQTTQAASGAAGTAQIQIVEQNERYQFAPQTLTIKKGTRVTWLNKSDAPHTVTSNNGAFSDSGMIAAGATFSLLFTTAGTYQYHCSIHTYMTATIIVTA
ncbi:cupredoxin domain-containing protein [Thermogemmatispora sp.]|uniref:cupredoxin domain-containing protein n=1 Tax=Thermogemmatispora sp. TaxID=1968838 RepID=UPI002ACBF146|nr:plastocyanin/azurin family copper-binding protein [Thermogemmatispora sp.]